MKINPKHDVQSAARIERATKKSSASAAASDFPDSARLTAQLAAIPDVRADKVARAKALIADPHFPDAKIVRAIARNLSGKIRSSSGSDS